MSDHNRQAVLAEGDILLSLFAPKALEKAAFPAPTVPGYELPSDSGFAGAGKPLQTAGNPRVLNSQIGPDEPYQELMGTPTGTGFAAAGGVLPPQYQGVTLGAGKPGPVESPVPQQSWMQRNQGPLALGGIGLAGALGGGALAYYKNQQEKKKRKLLGGQQEEQQTPAPKEAGVKRINVKLANDPLPEFKLNDTSSWKMGDRVGNVVSQPLNYVGKQIGAGASETANPFSGFGNYVKSNPWASMALVGAPIGAGIGLLSGLTNRKKKRDALGDMMTGGLLGAGAGALGGGALQMMQKKQETPPPAPNNVQETPGASASRPVGGGITESSYEKAKSFITGTPASAAAAKAEQDANRKIDFSAARVTPENPKSAPIQEAANMRAATRHDLYDKQQSVPTIWERALGIGDPAATGNATQAAGNFQDATKRLALQLNKLTPSDMTAVPGTPQGGARPNIANPMAGVMGGLGLGAQNTLDFNQHDANMKAVGLSGRARMSDTTTGRWQNRLTGDHYSGIDNWAPQDRQPAVDDAIVNPDALDAFAQNQTPQIPQAGAKGSLGANTAQNAALIGAGRLGLTQANRLRTGNTQNQADAARWAKGVLATLKAPAAPAQPRGLLSRVYNPDVSGAVKSVIGGTKGVLGLGTKPVTAEQFVNNPGATAALAATRATGQLSTAPMTADQVVKDILSGKPSPGTRSALQDLVKGKRMVDGEKVPVGRREVNLSQMPKLTSEQKATMGGTDGVLGKGTTVKEQLAPKVPEVPQAPPKPETVASKVTGDVKPAVPAAQTRGGAIVSTKAPPKAAPQQPPTQLPASAPSPAARIGDEDTSHFSGPRPATPPAEKATGPTPVRPQPAIVGRNNRDGSPIYATVPQVPATATPPDFSRVRGNTVYGADIGVGGKVVQAPPEPLITAPSSVTGGSSTPASDTTVSRPAAKTETPKVRDLPPTQAPAPQPTVKKPDAPKPQAKVTLPAVTGVGGRIGGQIRATGQNLALGGLAASLDKAVRGGADARSLGASAFGRENDPTDPANIRKLYEKVIGGSGATSQGARSVSAPKPKKDKE